MRILNNEFKTMGFLEVCYGEDIVRRSCCAVCINGLIVHGVKVMNIEDNVLFVRGKNGVEIARLLLHKVACICINREFGEYIFTPKIICNPMQPKKKDKIND